MCKCLGVEMNELISERLPPKSARHDPAKEILESWKAEIHLPTEFQVKTESADFRC
jgi:hypothetical protein